MSRGEGATSPNSSPSPLDEKETTIDEVLESKEVKVGDSKATVSKSENQAESIRALDSEQRALESSKLESAIDSESKNLVSRDTSLAAQYDNNLDSKKVDCRTNKPACNESKTETIPIRNSEFTEDSLNDNEESKPKFA